MPRKIVYLCLWRWKIFTIELSSKFLKRKIMFLLSSLTLFSTFMGGLYVHVFLASHTIDVDGDNDTRNNNKTTTIFGTTSVLTSFLIVLQSPTILEISLKILSRRVRASVVSTKVSSVDDFNHTIQDHWDLLLHIFFSSFSSPPHSTHFIRCLHWKSTHEQKNNVQNDNTQKHISYLLKRACFYVLFHFIFSFFI